MQAADDRRLRVVHVSGDFPDSFNPDKTRVIQNLIDLTKDRFQHEVWSINRVTPSGLASVRSSLACDANALLQVNAVPFDYGTALQYHAPGRGIFHATLLRALGDEIATRLKGLPPPDLLVAHKLTIEGLIVARVAQRLNIPYALCIQGNTDERILSARPDLRSSLRPVLRGASHVFPFTPWAQRVVERHLGPVRGEAKTLLPCPTELDQPTPPAAGGDRLISVFHLRHHKIKNLAGIAGAARRCATEGLLDHVEIVGGGSEADLSACRAIVGRAPHVEFAGPLDRDALRTRMNNASGMVLPSRRESFGLVFIEALFAGLPIVYPAGAAVDGYFDGLPFAIRVDARSPKQIAGAMRRLIEDEAQLKEALAAWQQSTDALRFQRPAIASAFAQGLLRAVSDQSGSGNVTSPRGA